MRRRFATPRAVRSSGERDGTLRKRSRSETYPTYQAADARRREIEAARAGTGVVVGRNERAEPFATYAALWVGEGATLSRSAS